MKGKRAPGGGRKPRAGQTSSLTFRIPDDLRQQLESEAADGGSLSERLLWHLRRSINRKRDEERDPALQALLYMIGNLAEHLSGAPYVPDKDARTLVEREWRSDPFIFQAFKVAVGKLLDAMEEPPKRSPISIPDEVVAKLEESLGLHFLKFMKEAHKTPENLGTFAFADLWARARKAEAERRSSTNTDDIIWSSVIEHEFNVLPKALKALELKPKPKGKAK